MNSRHLPLFFVDTLPPTDGVSILPTFLGFDQPPKDYLYWEFCTNNAWGHAVRKGQWKAVSLSLNEVSSSVTSIPYLPLCSRSSCLTYLLTFMRIRTLPSSTLRWFSRLLRSPIALTQTIQIGQRSTALAVYWTNKCGSVLFNLFLATIYTSISYQDYVRDSGEGFLPTEIPPNETSRAPANQLPRP